MMPIEPEKLKCLERIADALEGIHRALALQTIQQKAQAAEPAPKASRSKKEKAPEPEQFPAEPVAAPELKMSDLDLGDVKPDPEQFTLDDLKKCLGEFKKTHGVSAIADLFSRFELKHINDVKVDQIGEIMTFVRKTK